MDRSLDPPGGGDESLPSPRQVSRGMTSLSDILGDSEKRDFDGVQHRDSNFSGRVSTLPTTTFPGGGGNRGRSSRGGYQSAAATSWARRTNNANSPSPPTLSYSSANINNNNTPSSSSPSPAVGVPWEHYRCDEGNSKESREPRVTYNTSTVDRSEARQAVDDDECPNTTSHAPAASRRRYVPTSNTDAPTSPLSTSNAVVGHHTSAPATTAPSSLAGQSVWRPRRYRQAEQPQEQLKREVKSLMNKMTIEKFPVLVERLAALVEGLTSCEDLSEVVNLVLEKTVTEPDFSEMYADACQVLRFRCCKRVYYNVVDAPSLNAGDTREGGGRSFLATLLNGVQQEYERMPRTLELDPIQKTTLSSDEKELFVATTKVRVLGVCRLIAELFVRDLIKPTTVQRAIQELLIRKTQDGSAGDPEEHFVECVCEFCVTAGSFMDERPSTARFLHQIFGRLGELQKRPECSTRLSCIIQDLFDARKAKWHRKARKEKAKALGRIKDEAEMAEAVGGQHIVAQAGTVVKLGERANLSNTEYALYMKAQEELFVELQKKKC